MKFKLSRKRKKQYKKDLPKYLWPLWYSKEDWEWFYFRRRVEVRCMEVIMFDYPRIAYSTELLQYYKTNYPNDKLAHMYCMQNRHKYDKYNMNMKTRLLKFK